MYGLLYLASITQHNIFKVYPFHKHVNNSFLFRTGLYSIESATPLCLSTHQLINIWTISFLVIVYSAVVHICVYVYEHIFNSLAYIPRRRLLGRMINLCIDFKESSNYFSYWMQQFAITLAVYKGCNFSTSSQTLVTLFDYSHPSGCKMISNCGFYLNFPDGY